MASVHSMGSATGLDVCNTMQRNGYAYRCKYIHASVVKVTANPRSY